MPLVSRRLFLVVLVLFATLLLSACGGGGGGSAPRPVRVDATFALQGGGTVGAVDLDITLPDGFVPALDGNGEPSAAALTKLLATASLAVNYTAETATTNGRLQVAAIPGDAAAGFSGAAPLFKISVVYPANTPLPTAGDFLVSCAAYGLDTAPLATVTASVSLQSQTL